MEKKALRRDFDARLSEIGDDRRRCADRVAELDQLLVALRQELEVRRHYRPRGTVNPSACMYPIMDCILSIGRQFHSPLVNP